MKKYIKHLGRLILLFGLLSMNMISVSKPIAVAVFHDSKGVKISKTISPAQYKQMGERDGFKHNPTDPILTYSGMSYEYTDHRKINLLAFLTPHADAAIAFGATTTSSNNAASSITWSSPNVSGTNTIGEIDVLVQTDFANYNANWNGSSCPKIDQINTASSEAVADFLCIAPTAGVTNVVFNRPAQNDNAILVGAVYYTGAAQTGQPDNHGTKAQTTGSFTESLTVGVTNSWLTIAARGSSGSVLSATGPAVVKMGMGNNTSAPMADSNGGVSAGSQSITLTSASQEINAVMLSIAPAAGAVIKRGDSTWIDFE